MMMMMMMDLAVYSPQTPVIGSRSVLTTLPHGGPSSYFCLGHLEKFHVM